MAASTSNQPSKNGYSLVLDVKTHCARSQQGKWVCLWPADTQGNVHSHQVRTLDWRARKASFKEKAPTDIVQHVLDYVGALLEE